MKDKFEVVFMTHLKMLLELARRFLGPRREADAEDFAHDALERLMVKFPEEPPPEPRCACWLITTLTNIIFDDLRKQAVRRRAQPDPALHGTAAPPPSIPPDLAPAQSMVEKVLERLTNEGFRAAVASLRPKLRAAYELHMVGFTHAEIAAQLGISDVNVRQRLFHARQHLRRKLGLPEDES